MYDFFREINFTKKKSKIVVFILFIYFSEMGPKMKLLSQTKMILRSQMTKRKLSVLKTLELLGMKVAIIQLLRPHQGGI